MSADQIRAATSITLKQAADLEAAGLYRRIPGWLGGHGNVIDLIPVNPRAGLPAFRQWYGGRPYTR